MLQEIRTRAQEHQSLANLKDWFAEECKQNGYDYFDLLSFKTGLLKQPRDACEIYLNNYGVNDPWHYLTKTWPAEDGLMFQVSRSSAPLDYFTTLKACQQTAFVRIQKAFLITNGVRSAWILPYNTTDRLRCITVYCMSKKGGSLERGSPDLFLTGAVVMDRVSQLLESSHNQNPEHELGSQELNQKEVACLDAIADGQSNNDIAEAMGISANTVRYHLKKVFKKLQVTSRTEAASVAIKRGLLEKRP